MIELCQIGDDMAKIKVKNFSKDSKSSLSIFQKASPTRNLLIVAGMIVILEILILVFVPLQGNCSACNDCQALAA
jgi:hypothetical protein